MAGNSTVNTKPLALHLHDAKPCTRSAPSLKPTCDSRFQYPFSGGYGYPNPFMPTMPMLYNQGQNTFPFLQYPPALAPTAPGTQGINSHPMPVEYPEVTCWFRFLDEHEERSKDGIHFTPYGKVLKAKGFLQITQLTLDFVSLKDLQDILSINVGTAILIMQYAKEDIDGIKMGNLVIPKETGADFSINYE
jgi:hypothetical protein